MLDTKPHVLGNGSHLCTQFMKTGLFLLWGVRLGSLFILEGLSHVLGNGLLMLGGVLKKSIIKKSE